MSVDREDILLVTFLHEVISPYLFLISPSSSFRSRDSALRAMTLSSRSSRDFYLPILWQNVTLEVNRLFSFNQCLNANRCYGRMIKSIHLKPYRFKSQEEADLLQSQVMSLSKKDPNSDEGVRIFEGLFKMTLFLFQQLISLHTLIVEKDDFIPYALNQLPCLESSLKKLHIPLVRRVGEDYDDLSGVPLNAKNVVWILGFSSISECALGFTCSSTSDFDFLSEHHQAFAGRSKVKKLAIHFDFVYRDSDRRTWWGIPGEQDIGFLGGNKKSEAIVRLLSVTNKSLECLEIHRVIQEDRVNQGDETGFFFNCLDTLSNHFSSVSHLRVFGSDIGPHIDSDPIPLFSSFRSLRTLSLDRSLTFLWTNYNLSLPTSIERIILPFYRRPLIEDSDLSRLIRSRSLTNLKEVIIPTVPISSNGLVYDQPEYSQELEYWSERRKLLENDEIWKKVKLTKFKPGEVGE